MTSTRVWLVRHGQSTWNATSRVQGQSGEGLSDLGMRQATATATWLAASVASSVRLVSSDLQRAHETARPVAAALDVDVATDPALRERSFGSWEGRTAAQLEVEEPRRWHEWTTGTDVVAQAGGESGEVFGARIDPALRGHVAAAADAGVDDVVVVTHGGVIWHGLHLLLDLPMPTLGGVANASVSELLFVDGHVWLQGYNDHGHLAVDEATTFRPRELGHRR